MKQIKLASVMLSLSVLLSACAIDVTGNSNSIKQVKEAKLNNGTVTRVGYQAVENNWDCKELDKYSSNSSVNKIKGAFIAGSQYQALENGAIDYANQRANLKPNYVYLYVPTEVEVGKFNSSPFFKSEATYYDCKVVPEIKDSFASLFK